MVKRRYDNLSNDEPEQKKFILPSEGEHLFQVSDIFTCDDEMGQKLGLDDDTVSVKCEVVGSDEEGRTLLQRLNLNENWKGFFATRLFLKAISEQYKGKDISIDTDFWIGKQFFATVIHNGRFANIEGYPEGKNPVQKEIAWDDEEPVKKPPQNSVTKALKSKKPTPVEEESPL